MTAGEINALSAELTEATQQAEGFDPDAPLPDLHIPVRGLGIETVEEVEGDE